MGKTIALLIPVLASFAAALGAVAGKSKPGNLKAQNIAVTNLKAEEGTSASMASLMSDILRTELYKTGHFSVMNREDMDAILKEIKFQQSGACDQTACIVEMGQALGVAKMIAGSVGVFGNNYVINAKLIDIATAKNEVLVTESLLRDNAGGPQPAFRVIARKLAGLETSLESPSQAPPVAQGFVGRRYLFGLLGAYRSGKLRPGGASSGPSGDLSVRASGAGFGLEFEYRLASHLSFALQGTLATLTSKPDATTPASGTAQIGEGTIMGHWSPLKKTTRPFLALGVGFGGLSTKGITSLPGPAGTYLNPMLGMGLTVESKKGFAFWVNGYSKFIDDGTTKVNMGTVAAGVGLAR